MTRILLCKSVVGAPWQLSNASRSRIKGRQRPGICGAVQAGRNSNGGSVPVLVPCRSRARI